MTRRKRGLIALEHRSEPLASVAAFRTRLLRSATAAGCIVAFSLALGMAGYHWIVGVPDWADCLLSASMILGGMGPIGPAPSTTAGKVFASFYALYCGVILLVSVGVLLTPVAHRLMHRMHVEVDEP